MLLLQHGFIIVKNIFLFRVVSFWVRTIAISASERRLKTTMARERSSGRAAPNKRGRSVGRKAADAPASTLKQRSTPSKAVSARAGSPQSPAPTNRLQLSSSEPHSASSTGRKPSRSATSGAAGDSAGASRSSRHAAAAVVHPYLEEQNSPFQWLYKPHTVTGLFFGLTLLLIYAFVVPESTDPLEKRRRGIMLASVSFLVYCSINLRDSMLLRPHPIIWRVVHGCGILYLLGLSFLLAFPVDDAREMMRTFAPQLGGRPRQNDSLYAADCRLYTPEDPAGPFARVAETLDIFVIAHTLGWFGKALLLRDWRLGWTLSVLWELIEITFQKILPNFAECWWDHYFIDVLLGNGLGLLIGMMAVRWLQLHPYDWTGRNSKYPVSMSPLQQARDLGRQFLPKEFVRYEWKLFEAPKDLFAALLLIFIMEMIELNAFFLKYVLYVPPPTPINAYRLCFWFLLSLPATREYYAYATDPKVHRMGPNCWLSIVLMLVELMVVVKFGRVTNFPPGAGIPTTILYCWAVAGASFVVWCALKYGRFDRRSLLGRWRPTVMNLLLVTSVLALSYLAWSQDAGWGYQFQKGGYSRQA